MLIEQGPQRDGPPYDMDVVVLVLRVRSDDIDMAPQAADEVGPLGRFELRGGRAAHALTGELPVPMASASGEDQDRGADPQFLVPEAVLAVLHQAQEVLE